ncbi:ZIP zinc/iron transport family [Thozetella sp. PMI_491]|nr:ZIP zinc/iron transport family [Thozetella sp. PMI_491]
MADDTDGNYTFDPSNWHNYDGQLGARISALFVILIPRPFARRLKIPLYVNLFLRYFGAGVIVATALIHLLDPAYGEIGPNTCVGMTGHWADYSWPTAIAMTSVMTIFLLDFVAEWYVETKYGRSGAHGTGLENVVVPGRKAFHDNAVDDRQIAAFLILEFGVVFHSVIIGLNLGVAGHEFATLYLMLVSHQSFEGLGIGARLSAIPFPEDLSWLPWFFCPCYGLMTPIAIRALYCDIVPCVFDSISAGILIYTGLVELLARDFIFEPSPTRDKKQITFTMMCLYLGAEIMALLGKWP